MSRPIATLALCTVVLLLAAGCGDDDDEAGPTTTAPAETIGSGGPGGGGRDDQEAPAPAEPLPNPRARIAGNIEAVIGGNVSNFACGNLVTARYLRDAYGDAQGCRAAQSTEGSFDVRVRRIEVAGDTATAVAIPLGGPNEGIETDVELVLDGDVWKVDRLRADVPPGP